jgi:hypothetical protein
MKTFFSILSVPIRQESEEKLAIGLLLSNGIISKFHYSINKLKIVKNLVNESRYKFIKRYVKAIGKLNFKIDESNNLIFSPDTEDMQHPVVNEQYIDYLSLYNNNVITFCKPVRIDIAINEENFIRLFEKYIDFEQPVQERSLKQVSLVKEEFLPKVIQYFTEAKELTEKEYPSIIIPLTVDLFGMDHTPVYAQFVDLERSLNHIKCECYDLKQLKEALKDGVGFLISAEPDKETFNRQHNIWTSFRMSKDFEFVDVSEVEKIKIYAEEHGVKPW